MSDKYIKIFYDEICKSLEGEYKIILEPERNLKYDWIEYDQVKWEIEEPIYSLVKKLLKDNTLSFEERVLEIYKSICLNYIYDDNVLFFFRKDSSDPENIKYIAVDWYGRIVDEKWQKNRLNHNRRICYEFSRIFAKAINELLGDNNDIEAFMLGDKENTHYVVGLSGKEYSAILDPDDFNKIKDLTRLKLGLTLEGIKILRDENKILQKAINNFNKGKLEDLNETIKAKLELKNNGNVIDYFNKIVYILKPYNLDPQGFMEYMRQIIENEEFEIEKIWKEEKGGPEKRYVRCLIFEYNEDTYLLDSIEQTLNKIKIDTLDKNLFILNPEENEYKYYGG